MYLPCLDLPVGHSLGSKASVPLELLLEHQQDAFPAYCPSSAAFLPHSAALSVAVRVDAMQLGVVQLASALLVAVASVSPARRLGAPFVAAYPSAVVERWSLSVGTWEALGQPVAL